MKRLIIAGIVTSGLLMAGTALTQEAAPAPFKTSLSAGLTLTDGNSDTMQGNASLITEGEKKGIGSVRAGVEAKYGESKVDGVKETNVNNAKGFANAKKTISPLTFGYGDGSLLYDEIANIDYRATLGPGAGAYLVKNDKTALSVEAGPTYVWEKVADVQDDYLAVRFAQRFDHVLSPTSKIWESVEFLPRVDDFSDYLLNAEIGAEAAMTTRINLRLVLQDKYDSTPGAGLEENDLTLIGALAVLL